MNDRTDELSQRLGRAERLWLFLDYDGTLAEFAPTPDTIIPDPVLIELLTRLANRPEYRLAVVSGRRLGHIRKLLPVDGIWLAGTYGVELLSPGGELIHRLDYETVRSSLEELKPEWETLLSGRSDFYLEDKRWSLAIHARYASDRSADEIVDAAVQIAEQTVRNPLLRLLGGQKFLEICPTSANKGLTLQYLLDEDPFPGSLPVYIGDDDKDEDAFEVIRVQHGTAILVSSQPRHSRAEFRLESPGEVRALLTNLLNSG